MTEIPKALRRLTAREIEDALCIHEALSEPVERQGKWQPVHRSVPA